jgi:hypothetical protein
VREKQAYCLNAKAEKLYIIGDFDPVLYQRQTFKNVIFFLNETYH